MFRNDDRHGLGVGPLFVVIAIVAVPTASLNGQPLEGRPSDKHVTTPSPLSGEGRWVLSGKNPVIEGPALNSTWFYNYPNAVHIDTVNKRGYLLTHVREDKDADGIVEESDDRNIHLFTFDPSTPDSVTHEGTLLTATGADEEESAGGILEASMVVIGRKVHVYYTSWIGSDNTLLATAELDDMIGTITRQKVVLPHVALEVAYGNGLFFGITKGRSVDLYTSRDGRKWQLIERPLFDDGIDVDRGRDLKILAEKLLWFTYRDTNLPTMGITARVFDLRGPKMAQRRLGLLLSPTKRTPSLYEKGVDSPTVFTYRDKWYMYMGGMTHKNSLAGSKNDTKVLLFEWKARG